MTGRVLCLALSLLACTPAPAPSGAAATTTTTATTTTGTTTTTTGSEVSAQFDLGLPAFAIALLDLDDDGHLDIVTDAIDAAVQVLRGRGDGSFEPPRYLGDRLESRAFGIVGGDLDGDGTRDLAAQWAGHVAIVRGGLHAPHETLHFASFATSLVSVDADRDGLGDLFLAGANMLVRRYGHASGYLEPGPSLALGGEPADLVAADLDADGAVDLVVANLGTHDLSLLRGDGSGGFHPQTRIAVGLGPHRVAAADLDGDDIVDLVVRDSAGLVTLRGRGDAEFAAPHGTALPPSKFSPWTAASDLVVCERDGDARPEVLVSRTQNAGGWLVQLDADADARVVGPEFLRVGADVGQLACADLDGDGLGDLVFAADAGMGPYTLHVMLTGTP